MYDLFREGNVSNLSSSPIFSRAFCKGLKTSRDRPCLGHRPIINDKTGERGQYVWQTFRQVNHRIVNFGSGLLNLLNHTLNDPRTRQIPIGIWGVNRPEWTIADLSCAAYGLYTVSLYDTLGPDTVEYVMNHAEIETVVCSADHIADLLKLRHKLPKLRCIISMDTLEDDVAPGTGAASKSAIIKAWAQEKDVLLVDFAGIEAAGKKNRRSINLPKPEDLAFIMYTSGTTGWPKVRKERKEIRKKVRLKQCGGFLGCYVVSPQLRRCLLCN